MAELKKEQVGYFERNSEGDDSKAYVARAILQLNKRPYFELPEELSDNGIARLRHIAAREISLGSVMLRPKDAKIILTACGYPIEPPEPEKMEPLDLAGGRYYRRTPTIKVIYPLCSLSKFQ